MGTGLESLTNQHVVVLGGSRGIGLSVCQAARREGAFVHIVARGEHDLEEAQLRLGKGVTTTQMDVTDHDGLTQTLKNLPRIDHVFVSAGAFVPGEVHDGDLDTFRNALEVRLWGSVTAVRASIPHMVEGSSFVFTGGLAAARPHGNAWINSVATAAAEQLARAIAPTLARFQVRANAVSPGWTDTPMWDTILGPDKVSKLESVGRTVPLGRLGRSDEVAAAVLFLFKNRFVTGEVIHVDGGHRWS